MKGYYFKKSVLRKLWESVDFMVEANSYEEAVERAKRDEEDEIFDTDYENMGDGIVPPEENSGYPTFELYDDNNGYTDEPIYSNVPQNRIKVNNFDAILNFIEFDNRNEFYFLQILQRKKDGNQVRVSSGYRLIRSYYIYSKEELIKLKPRIIELCQNNNARAYINLNIRNAQEVALECVKSYADLVSNNNAFMGNTIWDSMCGKTKAKGKKHYFLIDFDSKDLETLEKVKQLINECRGAEGERVQLVLPTVNGYHLICKGFDVNQFHQKLLINNMEPVSIQKNNPTLLYY